MAYIVVVNPAILEAAGIPRGPCTVATILAAVFGTLLMALYANRPLAVAPYMGENAFIAFSLGQLAVDVTPSMRLATVFVSGVIFLIITVLRLRTWLAESISPSMKFSFAVGIGLFLAFIGLSTATQIVVPGKGVPVAITREWDTKVVLAIAGFVLIAILLCWRVRGAILIGIVATGVAGYVAGVGQKPEGIVDVPWSPEYDLSPIAFNLDIPGVLRLSFLPILITLVLVSFLDTL